MDREIVTVPFESFTFEPVTDVEAMVSGFGLSRRARVSSAARAVCSDPYPSLCWEMLRAAQRIVRDYRHKTGLDPRVIVRFSQC